MSPNTATRSPWRTVEEVAAELGVNPEYVRRQCKNGALVGTKLGNKWRIHDDAVKAFMAAGKKPASQPGRGKDTKKSARQLRRSP